MNQLFFAWDHHCPPDAIMISLARILSDAPAYEVPGAQGTYSLDACRNNWFGRIEDGVLKITSRHFTATHPVMEAVATLVEYRFALRRIHEK